MASGFPGGGGGGGDPGFYGVGGRSIGSPTTNGYMENINGGSNRLYRFQQQQGLVAGNLADQGGQIGYRRPDLLMIGKRSLAEFQSASQSNYFHSQQQQHLFMRSMKQRTDGFQNHTLSPISPLPPSIDLLSQDQSLLSSVSSLSTASSARHGVPLYPHHNNQIQQQPNFKPNNPGSNLNPGSRNRSKMMTTLQELEKQLWFDDDADDWIGGGKNDAVSGITHNEWSLLNSVSTIFEDVEGQHTLSSDLSRICLLWGRPQQLPSFWIA